MASSAGRIVFRFININALALLFLLASGCTGTGGKEPLPFYNTADLTAEWIKPSDKGYEAIHKIAPFRFTDQHGQPVSNHTFAGKIYVANFFFTACPSICPKMTKNLGILQERFKNDSDVMLLSFSVTPWRDSMPVLATYASEKGINYNKWRLATGDKEAIYHLARHSYFAEKRLGLQADSNEFLHTENALLIDGMGRIRGIYNSTLPLEMDRITEDINTLKNPTGLPEGR